MMYIILKNLWRLVVYGPKMEWMRRHPEKYSQEERYRMGMMLVNMVVRSGRIDVQSTGQENLPKDGGYLLVANHQGKFDPVALFATHPEKMSVVMDEARSHQVVTAHFLKAVDGLAMKKNNVRESFKTLKEVGARVEAGAKYLIFPEGGYDNNENKLQAFLPGAFKAAFYAKAPIVPVALVDTYKPFSRNSIRRVKTQVHYLKPILFEEYGTMRTAQVAEIVRSRIDQVVQSNALISA